MASLLSEDFNMFKVANSGFAFDVYKVLKSLKGGIFFSPFSISTALSMVFCGAKTNTATELTKALHYEDIENVAGCQESLSKLLNSLGDTVTLSSANKLCIQDNYPILKSFLDVMATHFLSEPQMCNFQSNAEGVRQEINNWVSQKTNDKIKDLLHSGSLDALTRLVIVNAVYFKGKWEKQFDAKQTSKKKFFVSPSENVMVDMMNKKAKFLYGENGDLGCKFVELPYQGGLSMVIILPSQDHNLSVVEDKLDATQFQNLLQKGTQRFDINVFLPRFTTKKHMDLVDTLKRLDVMNLFDPNQCDLSGIDSTRMLYVSSVVHQSFIDVNEEGSEAAAATAVVIRARCMPLPPTEFNVNQPFIFLIRHNASKTILFMGKVENPTVI